MEDVAGVVAKERLMATVFHNCGLLVNGKSNDLTSAMEEAKEIGVTFAMLTEYGVSHKFAPALMRAMEVAFTADPHPKG